MAGAGIPEEKMVQLVTNPETGLPIDAKTLRKHFRAELDSGHTKADTLVAQGLFKNATTSTKSFPGGVPVAQIFWLKTRARWRTVDKPEQPGDQAPSPELADEQETTRRLAFLLERGAQEAAKPKKKAKEPA